MARTSRRFRPVRESLKSANPHLRDAAYLLYVRLLDPSSEHSEGRFWMRSPEERSFDWDRSSAVLTEAEFMDAR